jgi:hypothetical protein
MRKIIVPVLRGHLSTFRTRVDLQLEVAGLRHQVEVLQRDQRSRVRLTRLDRALWVLLYRLWSRRLDAVAIVKPETVVRWHPSQTWLTFLRNHLECLASIDFFVVPTATFRILFVFIVLQHQRRRILHFGVTANPTSQWTSQQIREAFPWDSAPRYLIRDRDASYERYFYILDVQ